MLNSIAGILGVGLPAVFDSIQTTTVGAGGTASVTFSSIPQTYTHLQVRAIGRSGEAVNISNNLIRFNSDTTYTNYRTHFLYGDGSTASSATRQTTSYVGLVLTTASGSTAQANTFGAGVLDILDYTNTNKYKVIKSLSGLDLNGSGEIDLSSGVWLNTAAINTINIIGYNGNSLPQYCSYALYGIKAA